MTTEFYFFDLQTIISSRNAVTKYTSQISADSSASDSSVSAAAIQVTTNPSVL